MYSEFLEQIYSVNCDYEAGLRFIVILIGLLLIYLYFSCNSKCSIFVKCLIRIISIVSLLVLLYIFVCNAAFIFKPSIILFAALLFLINIFTFASTTVLDSKCPNVYCCNTGSLSCFSNSASCNGCNFT